MKKASKPKRKKATRSKALAVAAPAAVAKPEPWALRSEQVALLKRTVAKGTTDDEFQLFLWVARKHKLDPMTRQLHCVKRWSSALNTEVMAIQIGIDGYRSMAARYADYGSIEEPEYEFDASKKGAPDNPAGLILARVRVWKKGFEHPTVGIAFWDEYRPIDLNAPKAFMWKRMPKGQLAKCAEALALRKAYPDLADIYTDDEMQQADDHHAPSGRVITSSTDAPQALPPKEVKRLQQGSDALRRVEEADAAFAAAQSAPAKAVIPTAVAVEEPPEREPGDDSPGIGTAIIESVTELTTKQGQKMLRVRWNGREHGCFVPALYNFLIAGRGFPAQLIAQQVGKYSNITSILKIGRREFEDGTTPILDVNEIRPKTVRELY